jgi:CxxC motif-containing protein
MSVSETIGNIAVSGNKCKRGLEFAEQEIRDPQRVLTTTVKMENGELIPVRSVEKIAKADILDAVYAIKRVTLAIPAEQGEVVAQYKAVDIIAAMADTR